MVGIGSKNYGGAIYSSGDLTVTASTISNNEANYGGGIFLDNYGKLPLELKAQVMDSTISDNRGENVAGGIFNYGGDLTITGSTIISGNSGVYGNAGGGIYNTGTLNLVSGAISGNRGIGSGGGVYNAGTFTMKGGSGDFDNTAYNGSAGTWFTSKGGGIYNSGTLNLEGGTISGNYAYDGGGVYNYYGTLSIGGTTR